MSLIVGAASYALVFTTRKGCRDGYDTDSRRLEILIECGRRVPHGREVFSGRYIIGEGPGDDFAAIGNATGAEGNDAVHIKRAKGVHDFENFRPERMWCHADSRTHNLVTKCLLKTFQCICVCCKRLGGDDVDPRCANGIFDMICAI